MKKDAIAIPAFPRNIMNWSTDFYSECFAKLIPGFGLHEHDYGVADKKIAGNAQSISGGRWVHHTSFLWNVDPLAMSMLTLPNKRPDYRRDRSHADFLQPLSELMPHQTSFTNAICEQLHREFEVLYWDVSDFEGEQFEFLKEPHRQGTKWVSLEEHL